MFHGGIAGFEVGEVGHGGGKVDGGGGADRAEGVVQEQINVVGLRHGCNLRGFGETTNVANVDAGVLGNVAFEIRFELPLAGEFFPDRERHLGHFAQRFVRFG